MSEAVRCRCPCTCGHAHDEKHGTCVWCMTVRINRMRKVIMAAMELLSDGETELAHDVLRAETDA